MRYKRPESVLVVVYTRADAVLLLKRADLPDFWQSVTGALNWDETGPMQAAERELEEEIGLRAPPGALRDLGTVRCFPIFAQFRARYDKDVTHNVEYAFALELPAPITPKISREHTEHRWLSFEQALNMATSWTDRDAINRVRSDIDKR